MPLPRIVILLSGTGSLARALLTAAANDQLSGQIVAIGSDTSQAGGLELASQFGVPSFVLAPADFDDRSAWNDSLVAQLQTFEPDWIVSAGFMRILGAQVLASYPMRIINSHPSLLPTFPGADAVGDALAHGVKVTGCTIHLVDEGVDTGPILSQVAVNIEANQTKEQLHEQIKIQERSELVKVVANLCEGRLKLDGRRATFQ